MTKEVTHRLAFVCAPMQKEGIYNVIIVVMERRQQHKYRTKKAAFFGVERERECRDKSKLTRKGLVERVRVKTSGSF
jgi:hypothetical protein